VIIHKPKRTLRKTLIAVAILLGWSIVGGALYVYYSDRHAEVKPVSITTETKIDPVPKAQVQDPNAPESAAVQFIDSPIKAGENSQITIITGPNSKCTIVVAYNNVVSKDTGLAPKTADVRGSVSWTWTVEKTAKPGKWPVKVTCVRGNKTGYVEGTLEVTN
jgi:hypothetical protein